MRPNKTLKEASQYLLYVAEALHSVSNQFRIDKSHKLLLENYAETLLKFSENIEKIKMDMDSKDQQRKKEIEESVEEK